MVKIEKLLNKKYVSKSRGANLVLQMHDELIYEVDESDLEDVKLIMKDCMENCMELPVKMKVKLKWGKSWGHMESN
jgi:DNA polymerase I-like protein with 3'-5' exonuclease and polymerase domains